MPRRCYSWDEGGGEGCFPFPKDREKMSDWMESLNLLEVPPEHARICVGHFLPHEIEVRDDGRRFVNDLALPSKVL